jgi:hypothetical protein
MTVTIELPPDIGASLLAQAQAHGLGISDYVQNLVRGQVIAREKADVKSRPAYELSTDEWMRQFEAWTRSHAGNPVVLPDEAMERESIYGDRGL